MENKKPYTNTIDNLYTFMLIAMAIESYFGIEITDEEWGDVENIDDMINLINSKEINFKFK
jgi:acyl carrier protein